VSSAVDDGLVVTLYLGVPSPWDAYLQRRQYGAAGVKLERCRKCGKPRLGSKGPHAPQFREGQLVDCVGAPC
jgi:hypothetical protein